VPGIDYLIGKADVAVSELYHLPGFYDPFSSISHLAGAVLFLVLGSLLLWRGRGDRQRLIYLSIYVFSGVLLLSMSGVYHMMLGGGTARRVMERLDHGAIFVLIAGTFTPAHGILFRGWQRWGPLLLIWSACVACLTVKVVFFEDLPEWLGLSFYLFLGWLGTFAGVLLGRRYGIGFIALLFLGGVAYSVGALLEIFHWPVLVPHLIQPHEVFHVAVLLGVLCHWLFTWRFARGAPEELRTPSRVSLVPLSAE
jgi:channel protein (hemolysin III family)